MIKSRTAQLLLAMAAAMTLGACAHQQPEQRSATEYTDDTTINTQVQAAVLGVPGVHANDIQIDTYEGVVKLRGKVDSQAAAQNAIQAARQVAGVKSVDYDIDVAPK
ncbi:BON domain-containing protein [Pusillimonas sp. ANT_WB101]|uniref:BON domain-containing protein n=1 Tax=Pusillimonas sp. ANT_WB101 TaxID=2597356 RepID=UPI0011EEAF33|nr:BON domain-containing protein [Pusillimonas sp. ANT_WB101]KAA0910966.1 BON domain-containing protein [Pusillimonas sp. ANT_WB101]